jgi:hypothetical protein
MNPVRADGPECPERPDCEGAKGREAGGVLTEACNRAGPGEEPNTTAGVGDQARFFVGGGGEHVDLMTLAGEVERFRADEVTRGVTRRGRVRGGQDGDAQGLS